MTSHLTGLRRAGFMGQSAVLVAALAISYPLVGWLAGWLSSTTGVVAAGIAAVLCFVGAEVALIISHLLRPTPFAPFGFTAGMLPRMGIPLVFGLFFQVTVPPVAKAGLLLYVVIFYLVVLTVQAVVSIPVDKNTSCGDGPACTDRLTRHGP